MLEKPEECRFSLHWTNFPCFTRRALVRLSLQKRSTLPSVSRTIPIAEHIGVGATIPKIPNGESSNTLIL